MPSPSARPPRVFSYVRFSDDIQRTSDSVRRQTALAQAWCDANHQQLDPRSYADLGLSAFHGANIATGKLGLFLQAIKSGDIRPGDILLVESLDRLSRAQVLIALGTFQEIINAGITIITLADNRTYNSENLNDVGNLIFSIIIMARSHDESATKSKRLKAAWKNKREHAATKILTKSCPAWIELVNGKFQLIPERAAIVLDIFRMSNNGYGKQRITKHLNRHNILFFGRGNGWRETYIHNILHNKAVIGQFQPHIKEQGKRIPTDIILRDYFPRLMSDDEFAITQARIKQRIRAGGRPNRTHHNVFMGLVQCGYCGGTMRRDKKETIAFRCEQAYRGLGCDNLHRFPYTMCEGTLLFHIQSLDLGKMLNDKEDHTRILRTANLEKLNAERENIKAAILEGGNMRTLVLMLRDIESKIESAEKAAVEPPPPTIPLLSDDDWDGITVADRMDEPEFRIKIRDRIRSIVSSIRFYETHLTISYNISSTTDTVEYMV